MSCCVAPTPEQTLAGLLDLEATADAHPDRWDQAPSLHFLYRHHTEDPAAPLIAARWPVPPHWFNDRAVDTLVRHAAHLRQPEARYALLNACTWHLWVGCALIVQTYTLDVDPDDAEALARAEAIGRAGLVHSHPDRKEMRNIDAVTIGADGGGRRLWRLNHIEHQAPEFITPPTGVPAPDEPDNPFGGIGYAVAELADAAHELACRSLASGLYTGPAQNHEPGITFTN